MLTAEVDGATHAEKREAIPEGVNIEKRSDDCQRRKSGDTNGERTFGTGVETPRKMKLSLFDEFGLCTFG